MNTTFIIDAHMADNRVVQAMVTAVHATDSMRIAVNGTVLFITKEQAMRFFGLVEPKQP